MDKSFDFGRLLKNHEKKHKGIPSQFVSVAGGVKKRLETNLKSRRSSRLTVFDSLRNIPKCESPRKAPSVLNKVEHRRQQLELWKKEKEKQKREAAALKKKPFIAAAAPNALKFAPPPPPKPMPSASGRVTRSTTNKNKQNTAPLQNSFAPKTTSFKVTEIKNSTTKKLNSTAPTLNSFAPKNASFKPPEIKTLNKLPNLAPKTKKSNPQNITFDPVDPKVNQNVRQTRSRTTKPTIPDSKPIEKTTKTKAKPKPSPKKAKQLIKSISTSSSSSEMESTSPILVSLGRKSLPVQNSPAIVKKTPKKSLNNSLRTTTPNKPIPKSESSSEERLRSPKNLTSPGEPMTPEQIVEEAKKISPCVTMSRGKANARKEMKKKIDEGLLDEDASNMDCVEYFRKQLASEIERMSEMCATWDKISEQTVLPEVVQEAVLAAVGQARLLMSKKLQQFAKLIDRCAKPLPGESVVTPADLHGFWDMVFMQVENVDMRFKKLEEMRSRGWVEPVAEVKKKVTKVPPKKVTKPSVGPSRLRDMIAAARKAKKDQVIVTEPSTDEENKTFEAGFFTVKSPVRSPVVRTPNKGNLLKAVLSNEAKKASASKNLTSFAMLRASVLSKNYDCEGIAPISQTPMTPINLHATPGRSILKSTKKDTTNRKSIKVVLFDKSDAEIQDTDISVLPQTPNTKDNTDLLSMDSTEHKDKTDLSSMDSAETKDKTDLSIIIDSEKVENKENNTSARKSRLVRQDAEDRSPVLTRSRRKSGVTEAVTPRRSARKKVLEDFEDIVEEKAPTRSSRRRKSALQVQN